MNKLLCMTAAVAALTVTATPAFAVDPDEQARAHARIIKPLVLEHRADLDFGTIVLSGAGAWTGAVIDIDQDGTFTCLDANVVCSGTNSEAVYNLQGTNQQDVDITVSPTVNLVNQTDGTAPDLVMTVDAPATVTLTTSGVAGTDFGIGGTISVDSTTVDGVYEGVFDVTADYAG